MKTVKLGILINGKSVLQKLGNLELPSKKAWDLVDLLDFVIKKIEKFNKMREDKIRELGEDDGNGNVVIKDDNSIIEGTNYVNELLNIDEELNVEIKFTRDELVGFTSNELLILKEIVTVV